MSQCWVDHSWAVKKDEGLSRLLNCKMLLLQVSLGDGDLPSAADATSGDRWGARSGRCFSHHSHITCLSSSSNYARPESTPAGCHGHQAFPQHLQQGYGKHLRNRPSQWRREGGQWQRRKCVCRCGPCGNAGDIFRWQPWVRESPSARSRWGARVPQTQAQTQTQQAWSRSTQRQKSCRPQTAQEPGSSWRWSTLFWVWLHFTQAPCCWGWCPWAFVFC